MPELPEVETLRRSLLPHLLGRRIRRVALARRDVVRGLPRGATRARTALLEGQRVAEIRRHGKQLALIGDGGGCVCVHLGMSGSLCVVSAGRRRAETASKHVHVRWRLDDGRCLRFRDPRRFGGLWVFEDLPRLQEKRWDGLGPDALSITPGALHARLNQTRRALKAALLDQNLVAGLGNIYADEVLYAVRLHPLAPSNGLDPAGCRRVVRAIRRILSRALDNGGSTLRDYVDASGRPGGFQTRFKAYGRIGQPCARCGQLLEGLVVAGRTTSVCPRCQQSVNTTSEERIKPSSP